MNGEHPLEALSAYLDGELEAAESRSLETHLESCRSCAELLLDLRQLATASREEPVPPVPANLADRVLGSLGDPVTASPPPPGRRPFLFRIPMAAAASIAMLGILFILWREEPTLKQAPDLSPPPAPMDRLETAQATGDEDAALSRELADHPASHANEADEGDEAGPAPEDLRERAESRRLVEAELPRRKAQSPPESVIGTEAGRASGASATEPMAELEADEPRPDTSRPVAPETGATVGAMVVADGKLRANAPAAKTIVPDPADPQERSGGGLEQVAKSREESVPIAAEERERQVQDQVLAATPGPPPFDDATEGSWELRAPDHSIRVSPDGALLLRSPGYECTLPASEDASRLASLRAMLDGQEIGVDMAAKHQDKDRDEEKGDDKSQEGFLRTGAAANEALIAGNTRRYDLGEIEILGSDGKTTPAPPEVVQTLKLLLEARYTEAAVESCGELPAPFRPSER